ncbi:MAG: hypothetical protein U1E84_05055 [Rhodoferax sp.]
MPISTKVIRVPVKLVDGGWELLYGGAVKVKEGAIGDLHLDQMYFTDKKFLKALTIKRRVEVLAAGTELRVALSVKPGLDATLWSHLLARDATPHRHTAKISGDTRFVSIRLGGPTAAQQKKKVNHGGLFLLLEGMEPRAIESGMVNLPPVPGLDPVDSLNYAFTRLSEVFEPWRKAHTGSIYERIFYLERDQHWYPLKDLRDRALATAERALIKDLWAAVAEQLGTALF